MDIREAKYMLELAKTKHLTRAANNLFITQPALTKVLKKLEYEFGGALFYRDAGMMCPTALGKIILKKSANVVKEFEELDNEVRRLKEQQSNTIHVGLVILSSFLYAPALLAFGEEYPDIRVVPQELFGSDIVTQMRNSNLDLAFSIHMENMDDFNEYPVFTSEVAVGVDQSHELAKKEYIVDEDLIGQPYSSFDRRTGVYEKLNARLRAKNITPVYGMLGTELEWLVNYAKSANVPCILPLPNLELYGWPTMVIRRFNPPLPWTLSLIHPKDKPLSEAERIFVNFFLDYYYSQKHDTIITRNERLFDISKIIR